MSGLATAETSTRGLLPDRKDDIHCPLMGGPEYRTNYTMLSCNARQAAGGCRNLTCQYHEKQNHAAHTSRANEGTPPEPGVTAGETAQKTEEEPVTTAKTKAACLHCNKVKTIPARGLCGSCYKKMKDAGRLEEFQSGRSGDVMRSPGRKKKVAEERESVIPINHPVDRPIDSDRVSLWFEGDADRQLYQEIKAAAAKERRTVEAQILYMLDNNLSRVCGCA